MFSPLYFQVQVDDQVVFESIKSHGQYLHVSKNVLGTVSVYSKKSVSRIEIMSS
ncbi:hypothetical protein DPMN_144565 [Dreissena polymorpha]|uniref:Uncharacterized protein n=1 Tax=Dreissena polymorpha TaxID=45954 RepID=A0A9D4GF86_DREPO|nr:hypothetical protein DPMN_144565 [Dreissena polymorpha]